MRKLIAMGVDGIVTDNPYLVTYCLRNMSSNQLVQAIADRAFPEILGETDDVGRTIAEE
ncbi:MAG: hypothetical protein ACLR23_23820 [Clostridia bacterium]